MLELITEFINTKKIKHNNNINIDADGNFDQELLYNMLMKKKFKGIIH